MDSMYIAYEDPWIIAVCKPSGLASQATVADRKNCLDEYVRELIRTRDGIPEPYIALHHRLDRPTSGVMLLAKHRDANKGLSSAFKDRTAKKTYRALCRGDAQTTVRFSPSGQNPDPFLAPGLQWEVENHLKQAKGSRRERSKMEVVYAGGDYARTAFTVMAIENELVDIEARPWTGRTHQIRVHLADCGLPILGDCLYGTSADRNRSKRLMLHAHSIALDHPVTGKPLTITCPVPPDWALV